MPKLINYKTNSVIYFAEYFADTIYILKDGNVVLTYPDIETGEMITEKIKTGELFGVKAVLGNFPREETAMVVSDATVYAFTAEEFESFAVKNPRIILQMIKKYSKQLRRIHSQIKNLTKETDDKSVSEENFSNDDGLFSVAEAFFNSENYAICAEVCKRYISSMPNGKYVQRVSQLLATCQNVDDDTGLPKNPFDNTSASYKMNLESLRDATRTEEQGNLESAIQKYKNLLNNGDPETVDFAILGLSRCLLKLGHYEENIKFLNTMIKRNPKSRRLDKMLLYIGNNYEKMGSNDKAKSFFAKAEEYMTYGDLSEKVELPQTDCDDGKGMGRFAKHFKKGELIFAEYERGDVFYLIQKGQVQLIKIINGFEKNLDILQPHEFFGEMAILDNSPRSASAIAYDDVAALEFNKDNFVQLINGNPEISMVLLRTFVRRVYEQKRRYMLLAIPDKQARIADVFIMLDETLENIDRSSEMRIFEITLEGVARWAGMNLQEVEDNIRKFLDQGRIEVFTDRIVVQNMAQLKRFVQAHRPKQEKF